MSSEQLQQLLLSASTAPAGVSVQGLDMSDTSDDGSADDAASKPGRLSCDELLAASFALRDDPAVHLYGRANTMLLDRNTTWLGQEWLFSYSGGDAAHAVKDFRDLVGRCPGVDGESYSVAAGPELGDESLVFVDSRSVNGQPANRVSVLVRTGATVVLISSTSRTAPNASTLDSRLRELVEAASNAYQNVPSANP